MRVGSDVRIVRPQNRSPGYVDFRFADDGTFFLVVGFGFRDPTYARLISKKRRSSFVFTRSESGTTTYSGCTIPYCDDSVVLYFLKNASRSTAGRRSATEPSLCTTLNMWPFSDV